VIIDKNKFDFIAGQFNGELSLIKKLLISNEYFNIVGKDIHITETGKELLEMVKKALTKQKESVKL